MTNGNSFEHLSVVMTTETTDDVTQVTADNVATSSSSFLVEHYFQCAVVVIGVVGTAANALILYAFIASKQHQKNVLIFNQNVLDFCSSFLLVISYAVKLCNIRLSGPGGYWLCMLIVTENLPWCVILASKTNLMIVTIERYLKVVYPIWSKKKLRNWMINSAMAFAWISGFVHNFALIFSTSAVIDGVCYAYVVWNGLQDQIAFGIWYFVSFYVVVLVLFVFCYWRILVVIRRQARVMASHGSTSGQAQSQQIENNVIKTMIFVSAFYAVCDLPVNMYALLLFTDPIDSGYYAAMFLSFFYICANPFIYAAKFDPVKGVLVSLIPCKKTSLQPAQSIDVAAAPAAATRHTTDQ